MILSGPLKPGTEEVGVLGGGASSGGAGPSGRRPYPWAPGPMPQSSRR